MNLEVNAQEGVIYCRAERGLTLLFPGRRGGLRRGPPSAWQRRTNAATRRKRRVTGCGDMSTFIFQFLQPPNIILILPAQAEGF